MQKKRLFILLPLTFLMAFSCQNDSNKVKEKHQSKNKTEILNSDKKSQYQEIMVKKNISLSINGPCDDALEDTLHERYTAYIESQNISDSSIIVKFKFKDACCQEYLGDYTLKNDTLLFEFDQVNDEMCSCICWYRYLLKIDKVKPHINHIEVKGYKK